MKNWLLLSLFLILGCSNEEVVAPVDAIQNINVSPNNFGVSVQQVGNTYAVLEWTQSHDYDNNPLTYTIYLQGEKFGTVPKDFLIRFLNLTPNTDYTGSIEVTDSFSEPIVKEFSFRTTESAFTTFSRLFSEFDNGNRQAGYSILTTDDKGFIVGGEAGYNFYQKAIYLAKFDSLGFEEWHTLTLSHDTTLEGFTLSKTSDAGYLVCQGNHIAKFDSNGILQWQDYSLYFKTVVQLPTGEYMALIHGGSTAKFDTNGTLLWTRPYDLSEFTRGKSMCLSPDDNVIILETSGDYYDYDITVRKMNLEGDLLWTQVYDNEKYNFAEEIVPNNSGYLVLANIVDPAYSAHYSRVISIDADGNQIWDKTYGNGFTHYYGIEPTSDGNICIVGTEGNYSSLAFHVKIDQSGEQVWRHEYFPTNSLDFNWSFRDVKETSDKGLILLGGKGYTWYYSPEKQEGMWLHKTDPDGEHDPN